MNNTKQLEHEIEILRLKMYEAFAKNPNDEEVIKISQHLDELMNEYTRLTSTRGNLK